MDEQAQGIGYASLGGDKYQGAMSGQGAANAIRKPTPAEHIRDNAERALNRLASVQTSLAGLRERLCGPQPPSVDQATRDTMNAGGFINSTGSAIERIHIEITEIDALLNAISEVV